MVYHDPFRRLVFSGTLYDVEGWSCSLSMGHFGIGDAENVGTVPAGIITAAEAFFSNAYIGAHAKLNTIKYNVINTGGRYADATATVRWDAQSPTSGASSFLAIPQAALAVSLMTENQRGPAHAGRFFMPLFAGVIYTDGRLTVAAATTIAEHVTTFLNALNAVDTEYQAVVVSNVGTGAQHKVTNCRIGRVIDTIRSRRTSLLEAPVDGMDLA